MIKVGVKGNWGGPCDRAPRTLGRCSVDTLSEDRPNRPSHRRHNLMLFVITLVFLPINLFMLSIDVSAEEKKEGGKEQKEIHDVLKKLQARYEQTKDLQADFQQTTRIEGFATPLTSSGQMSIKKPGLLRWDYRDPTVEEIYVNRNDVMMYVPEHKQVLVGKLTQMAASQAPLQLLQGVAKIDEEFDVEATPGRERGDGGLPLITLTPKSTEPDASRSVSKLVVEVQPKTYFIKSVAIHEISGNISTFVFSGLKPNTGLKSGLFEFKVPAGVEVVKAPTLSPP
jgi:outer membrane lipoprotein carrier protein